MPGPRKDRHPGILFSIVVCLFLTSNSQSLICDYIFQINPSFSWPTGMLGIAFNLTSSAMEPPELWMCSYTWPLIRRHPNPL